MPFTWLCDLDPRVQPARVSKPSGLRSPQRGVEGRCPELPRAAGSGVPFLGWFLISPKQLIFEFSLFLGQAQHCDHTSKDQ